MGLMPPLGIMPPQVQAKIVPRDLWLPTPGCNCPETPRIRARSPPPSTVAYRRYSAQDREVENLSPPKSWPDALLDLEVSLGTPDRSNQLPAIIGASRKIFQAIKSIESLLHWPGTHSFLPPCKLKGPNSSNSNCVCAQHPNAAPQSSPGSIQRWV